MCVGNGLGCEGISCRTSGMPWLDRVLFSIFDKFASVAITSGCMTILLPDGREHAYGRLEDVQTAVPGAALWQGLPQKKCRIVVKNTDFFYKILTRHDTGLGEAYMRGDILVDDVGALMAVMTANAFSIEGNRGILGSFNWIGDRLLYLAHLTRANTIEGSKRNISEHYDVGNEMYKLFLDETLTYSAGIHAEGASLKDAQLRKLDALIAGAGVSCDSHVLEVGCGWGSCAIRAVKTTGCRWTGITVSMEQLVEALARVKEAGLQDRISLIFCDYREVVNRFGANYFDAVVSCEMIEAVGHEHLPTYFDVIGQAVKPGGLFAMQVISMPDARYEAYCETSDFIREHIFPGGHLPSVGAMTACASAAQLSAVGLVDIGPDYAISLRAWRTKWKENWSNIKNLGNSEEFMRKWEFYFAYCEAAFDSRYLQDYQIVWQRSHRPLQQPQSPQKISRSTGRAMLFDSADIETVNSPARFSQTSSDAITVALFAVYCILGGVVVARQPRMLLALITFILGQASMKVSKQLLPVLIEGFESLSLRGQAAWIVDSAHSVWSILLGLPALGLLLSSSSWTSALQPRDAAPAVLVYLAAGFWASHLAALIKTRMFLVRPISLAHSALLLAIFGSAGFKEEHTGLLAMTLPALLCSVPSTVSKLHAVRGLHTPTWLSIVDLGMLMTLQCLLHAVVLLLVVVTPDIWSSPVYYMCATNGMLYANWINVSALRTSPHLRWFGKQIRSTCQSGLSLKTSE